MGGCPPYLQPCYDFACGGLEDTVFDLFRLWNFENFCQDGITEIIRTESQKFYGRNNRNSTDGITEIIWTESQKFYGRNNRNSTDGITGGRTDGRTEKSLMEVGGTHLKM